MMKAKKLRKFIVIVIAILVLLSIVFATLYIYLDYKYKDRIFTSVNDIPNADVALVFGAGYRKDGFLYSVLRDRVEKAVDLYKSGKVKKLLMSGDNPVKEYNEPKAMQKKAIELGVKKEDIRLDFAGKRTYDSCYRLKHIWMQNKVILLTQEYHLPRALYICNELGVNAYGLIADKRPYLNHKYYRVREIPALIWSWIEINITKPLPKFLGNKEDIMKIEIDKN